MIRIGTRGSLLALWQANHVEQQLRALDPGLEIEQVIIKTTGDKILDKPLAEIGGKGLFLKEIEEALADGRVDLAVHSMKDVPAEMPPGLWIASILERENPYDALITPQGETLDQLPEGSVIGTGSLRRCSQLLHHRPDLMLKPIRGNVDTRLRKLDDPQEGMSGIILACAGLIRLGFGDRISQQLPGDIILPAVAQGAIGIEIREGDSDVEGLVKQLNHERSAIRVAAERAFLGRLGGSCKLPVAGFARFNGPNLQIDALVGAADGSDLLRDRMSGPPDQAEATGRNLADRMLQNGAAQYLELAQ